MQSSYRLCCLLTGLQNNVFARGPAFACTGYLERQLHARHDAQFLARCTATHLPDLLAVQPPKDRRWHFPF